MLFQGSNLHFLSIHNCMQPYFWSKPTQGNKISLGLMTPFRIVIPNSRVVGLNSLWMHLSPLTTPSPNP